MLIEAQRNVPGKGFPGHFFPYLKKKFIKNIHQIHQKSEPMNSGNLDQRNLGQRNLDKPH